MIVCPRCGKYPVGMGHICLPPVCEHGAWPGECADDGCLHRREVKNALLGLAGSVTAASDQAQAMTDAELGELLLSGKWSTIEVHEAGWRLSRRG